MDHHGRDMPFAETLNICGHTIGTLIGTRSRKTVMQLSDCAFTISAKLPGQWDCS
jgi:hypothetical protein